MSKFPNGNFTIINDETGRAVRARLGKSVDTSDHRLGTKYLQSVTDKPSLHLGAADNSPATAWWHNTAEDAVERRPFNQIVSHAVGEYQNIGEYSVWLYTSSLDEHEDTKRAHILYMDRLENMSKETRDKLNPLIPSAFWAYRVKTRADEAENGPRLRVRAEQDAERQAWSEDEDAPDADKLARFLDIQKRRRRDMPVTDEEEWEREQQGLGYGYQPTEESRQLLKEFGVQPRAARVEARVEELRTQLMESRKKELLNPEPTLADLMDWNQNCAFVAFYGESGIRLTNSNTRTAEDKKIAAAMTAYIKAAAEEGITKAGGASSARTGMYGAGASRSGGSTYAWTYDGTYIYGADSKTVPSERTYWTDEDGYLVGRNKGGAGQKWTLAPWTPTPEPKISDGLALVRTGLFGPIGFFFSL
ncbi:hypothetical protein ACFWNQ_22770 [Streptomyces virginiae]|uniref:hypothetical protein n=1 Tax=Streptomyces virginiae TaxID=1961 RepID=UPI003656745F